METANHGVMYGMDTELKNLNMKDKLQKSSFRKKATDILRLKQNTGMLFRRQ